MEKINLTAWACFHNDGCKWVALKTHLTETSPPQIKVAYNHTVWWKLYTGYHIVKATSNCFKTFVNLKDFCE